MTFADHFGLCGTQADFDFVDVPLHTDIRLFLDPYAVSTTNTPWAVTAHEIARDYFKTVLSELRGGNRTQAIALVAEIHEDNRTRTGFSTGRPRGSAFGKSTAAPLIDALEKSEAFKTGQIEDIEDTALFVADIGIDLVSDIMVNVLRGHLAAYTAEQCELYGIFISFSDQFRAWEVAKGWVQSHHLLPTYDGLPILLTPRSIVRRQLSLNADGLITEVLDRAESGVGHAMAALTELLQRQPRTRGRLDRKAIRDEIHEKKAIKNSAADLARVDRDALKRYKDKARSTKHGVLPGQIESLQPPTESPEAKVARENRSAAANAVPIPGTIDAILRAVMPALHPLIQHPRLRAIPFPNASAVALSCAAASGPFRPPTGNKSGNDDLLIISLSQSIGKQSFGFDWKALRQASKCATGLVVGTGFDKPFTRERASAAKERLYFVSSDDLLKLQSAPGGAEGGLKRLGRMVL